MKLRFFMKFPVKKIRWPFLLFCAVWFSVLAVPMLRQMLFIQLNGGNEPFCQKWTYGPFRNWRWIWSLERVGKQFFDDPRAQAIALENKTGDSDSEQRQMLKSYDLLIRRFPHENWLVARRLILTIHWMKQTRLGGEISDAHKAAHKAAGIPSPEWPKEPANFTSQDLHAALAMAQLSTQREPNNAFFNWAQFYLLLMNWRDKEAWMVVSRASHKADYNEHESEFFQAHIAVREMDIGRKLLWEEKGNIRDSLDIGGALNITLIGGKERELARIVEWEGIKAGRRNDHQKALQIYSDYARLQTLHGRHSYGVIEAVASYARVVVGIGGAGYVLRSELPPGQLHSNEAWARISARRFAHYATKHGRPDLAREIGQMRLASCREQDKIIAQSKNPNYYNGMPVRPMIKSVTLWWATEILLLFLTVLFFLWLVLTIVLKLLSFPVPDVAWHDTAKATILGFLVAALCFGIPLCQGLGWKASLLFMGYLSSMKMADLTYEQRDILSNLLLLGVITPPILISFWCWGATWQRAQKQQLQTDDFLPPRWRDQLREIRLAPLFGTLALLTFIAGAAVWWLLVLLKGGQPIDLSLMTSWPLGKPFRSVSITPVNPLWPLGCFAVGLLAIWLRPLFKANASEKPFVAYRVRWIHQTLGALLVLGSVAYVVLGVIMLPIRHTAEANFDQYVKRGEFSLMRENIWR